MSINDDILSRELKHRALLSLYEKKLDIDLTKVMSSHKKRLVSSTLKNGAKGANALNRALSLETRKTYRKIYKSGIAELKALSGTSSKFHNATLKQSLGKIYRSKVYTGLKVNDLIINSAGTYSQQIASISLAQQRKIKSVVKKGMMDNLAVNKIAKNIGDTTMLPTAQLRTLSRTAITETSSNISNATYKLNEDVIDGYQYVATLDSRTSLICSRLDGKVFRLDSKTGIRPPQHFNCRSTTVPIVKSYEDIKNTSSSRISKRRLTRLNTNKRASFSGQVPAKTNFEEFLRQQDQSFKLAILGNKRRVEIFDLGKLRFSQFSTAQGQLVSISQLESLLFKSTSAVTKVKPIVLKKVKKVAVKVPTARPVKALSSYNNPVDDIEVQMSELKPKINNAKFKSRLYSSIKAAHADPRYVKGFRFRGAQESVGVLKVTGDKLSDKESFIIAALWDELGDLAEKYRIPKLRGLEVKSTYGFAASMGDGVLRVNRKWLRNYINDFDIDEWELNDWTYKTTGRFGRKPEGFDSFFANGTDRVRQTFYHEFAHHIHQQMGVPKAIARAQVYNGAFTPVVERRLAVLFEKHRLHTQGNSTYGQKNPKEWFAEQFSAYAMNKKDNVHPVFKKLIKEIEDGKYQ